MDSLIIALFVCIAIPMGLTLVILDKKGKLIIGFVIIGMGICVYIAGVNGWLLSLFGNDTFYVTTTLTPISEEIAKALPILFFAFVFSDDREVLILISVAIGMGFAVMENAYIILNFDHITLVWAFIRAFGAGLMHSLCSLAVGYGSSFIRKKRKLFFSGTFALLILAIIYHATYNLLIQSQLKPVGVCMPLLTYLPLIVWMWNKKYKKK